MGIKKIYILGIAAYYHDSAACLICEGNIIAAAQEERFTRKKHDEKFPHNAILFCIEQAKIEPSEIAEIIFYEKPFVKFERLLETYLTYAPRGFVSFAKAMPVWVKDKLFQKQNLAQQLKITLGKDVDWKSRLLFSEHHLSHAASAFYPSPFDEAAVLTIDGVGEWTTTSIAIGSGKKISVLKEIKFPHSLGLLYSAFTYFTGFKVNSGEYKVMGLAPYGEPRYVDIIKDNLISIAEDGSFKLDMTYFNYATGLTMTNKKFNKLLGGEPRSPEAKLTQREMDIAASIQKVIEEVIVKIAQNIAIETGQKNLCLAGGVALNCVANSILQKQRLFENIWIQPASGDAGCSLGAALYAWYTNHATSREIAAEQDSMLGSFLGPSFNDSQIEEVLNEIGANYVKLETAELIERVVDAMTKEYAVGWMQGRMEFGPRALGARSIIADPRSSKIQKQLNLKVKYRESFRPFAPSVLEEYFQDWFQLEPFSPYMLLVADVHPNHTIEMSSSDQKLFGIEKLNVVRSSVPAITHVDYSARIQTVHKKTNPIYHSLITRFHEVTGCPMLVNTSFNVRGEPIVCNPKDAFDCFMGTELDLLVIGNFLLKKSDQNTNLLLDYSSKYELD